MKNKVAMFYWSGEKLSFLRYLTFLSFRKYHPDWKIIMYTSKKNLFDKNLWEHESIYQDFFFYHKEDYRSKLLDLNIEIRDWNPDFIDIQQLSESHKADICRWQMLSENGGIFFDTDILFIKNINSFYDSLSEINLCIPFFRETFPIGVIYSSPNNVLIAKTLRKALKNFKINSYGSAGAGAFLKCLIGSETITNKDPLKTISKRYPNMKLSIMKKEIFYPYDYRKLKKLYNKTNSTIPDECLGIHWYGGNKRSQKFNSYLTSENISKEINTLGFYCKKVYLG